MAQPARRHVTAPPKEPPVDPEAIDRAYHYHRARRNARLRRKREKSHARLRFFLTQAIDTTVRGFVYEARGIASPPGLLAEGEAIARELTEQNAIPAAFLTSDPADAAAWIAEARGAIDSLLSCR